MKRAAMSGVAFIFAVFVAPSAWAQGRHDEKPHGAPAKAQSRGVQYAPVPVSGGRHDERPHGPRKALDAKRDLQSTLVTAPTGDACCK